MTIKRMEEREFSQRFQAVKHEHLLVGEGIWFPASDAELVMEAEGRQADAAQQDLAAANLMAEPQGQHNKELL